jgi:hypothetical protein
MRLLRFIPLFVAVTFVFAIMARGEDTATITIDSSKPTKPISRFLTSACLEDVNHEVYGGLWSQLIFGESFQEPAPATAGKLAVSGCSLRRWHIHLIQTKIRRFFRRIPSPFAHGTDETGRRVLTARCG